MGMFDNVKCEYPLPFVKGVDVNAEVYQTKDLDSALLEYVIKENGELWVKRFDIESVPEENRPYFGKSEWNEHPLFKIIGSLTHTNERDEKVDIGTTPISMYTIIELNNKKMWLEYDVFFVKGIVKHIELKSFRELEAIRLD